eukprot:jgi/Mesvir1/14870/Mv05483-RA.1
MRMAQSISEKLCVPEDAIVHRMKGQKEAYLLTSISNTAKLLEQLLSHYEALAPRSKALQRTWESLWLAKDLMMHAALPLVGQAMSDNNNARALLMERIDEALVSLQSMGERLGSYCEANEGLVQELQLEPSQPPKLKLLVAEKAFQLSSLWDGACLLKTLLKRLGSLA